MLPRLRSFLTTLAQRERFEDSLDEEMRFHLDGQTEDLIRTGMPPAEAARRARAVRQHRSHEKRLPAGAPPVDRRRAAARAAHVPAVGSVARPEILE